MKKPVRPAQNRPKKEKPQPRRSRFLLKQAENLFPDPVEREAFLVALEEGTSRERAIIVLDEQPAIRTFPRLGPTEWQPPFVLRLSHDFRASQHPLYEKGAYYTLDFSSIFSASLLMAIREPIENVLDLCASPGGKAIFAWRAFRPKRLVCNETIRKRTVSLIANLDRCGITGSSVWSADPSVYVKHYPQAFDLVIVDAPCSGQSLLAKGQEADECWTPEMIDMCVGRQRRIVGNALQCLRPGGYLLYSTCTFAIKENEKIVQWALSQHPDLEAVEVPGHEAFRSKYSDHACYRLFPQSNLGAGAFAVLFRRKPTDAPRFEFGDHPALWRFGDVVRSKLNQGEPEVVAPEPFKAPKEPRPKPKPKKKPHRSQIVKPPKEAGGRRGRRTNRPK